jgi:cytochrome d ubiquinol oxidase subunit II
MESLWFVLVALMLAVYVLLDGFDLGAGAIHPFVARTEVERRMVYQAIGPVWDGNEVWLLAAGGTLFFTFPRLYAAAFSGFYLPLMIVLWLLMLRGLALELRSHIQNAVWSDLWDGLFFVGSTLLAIFYGAALANVIRGVPLDAQGYFFEPLWTDFNPSGPTPGILDWYTILVGLLALAALVLHGAHYIAFKTEGSVNSRARALARRAWLATLVLTIFATIVTFTVRPGLFSSFVARPWGVVFPMLAVGGLGAIWWSHVQRHDGRGLVASGAYLAGMLTSAAFTLYPAVLPAVDPSHTLTVANAAGPTYGLVVGLVWWTVGMLLAAVYFVLIYRLFRGKVRPVEGDVGY